MMSGTRRLVVVLKMETALRVTRAAYAARLTRSDFVELMLADKLYSEKEKKEYDKIQKK